MPHKEHTVLQLQTAGHIASYYEIDTRTWDSKRAHPNNALYGLLEPGGAIVFRDCISEVFRAAGVLVCGHREFSPEAIDTATRYLQYRYDSVVEPPLVTDRDIRVMTVYEHLERMQMASRVFFDLNHAPNWCLTPLCSDNRLQTVLSNRTGGHDRLVAGHGKPVRILLRELLL